MANTLIKIENLKKSFPIADGQIDILKGINIDVNQGEFIIIFGPSGCGKSTLLHVLLGLEEPTSGKVTVENKDFYSMSDDERALYRRHKVGMIYQQPLWISSLKVYENLCFPLALLDMNQVDINKKATEALELVGMSKWAHYVPAELSGGQQQKISLARALMIDPILIVADEPTGNLDTVSGNELLATFNELVKKGKTIIMVTHDLEYLKYASKIFHIVDGEIVEQGTAKEILANKKDTVGKKEINHGKAGASDVRDRNFLKKITT